MTLNVLLRRESDLSALSELLMSMPSNREFSHERDQYNLVSAV
jgi:hypothetical protein